MLVWQQLRGRQAPTLMRTLCQNLQVRLIRDCRSELVHARFAQLSTPCVMQGHA